MARTPVQSENYPTHTNPKRI